MLVYLRDGSVARGHFDWGFIFKLGGRIVHEENGAYRDTTSNLTMQVESVTNTIQWVASQHDTQITHAIILTDSMNLLQKVKSGMGCPDWHTAMHSLWLQRLLLIYCLGHAGVSGNEWVGKSAYGPCWALQCCLEQKLNWNLSSLINIQGGEFNLHDFVKKRKTILACILTFTG